MFATSGSPVSAFAVYKQKIHKKQPNVNTIPVNIPTKKQKKGSSDTLPQKKRKIIPEKIQISQSFSGVLNNGISKQQEITKISKTKSHKIKNNINKKKSKIKELKKLKKSKPRTKINNGIDSDEPPLLVPIQLPKLKSKQKFENGDYGSKKSVDISLSEILTSLHKTDPTPEGLKLFKWLIASVNPKDFFEKFWEKEALFIERNSPDYYKNLLSTQRLDDIFREFPLFYTRNVDVVSYENGVKEVHNEEGRVVASALYDYYSNGCSIRVLNPQTYDQKVHLLIATLQEYFGTMVGTNVYLTPPGSQGFAPHFDDIEAFIVQLEGRKHWKLYKPQDHDILARDSSHNFTREEIGEPIMEVTLNAGDLLYFPRGTIHEGRTDEDAHSLHITVSVYQHTSYIDLLEQIVPAALKKASENDVSFRRGLPINYLKHVGYVNSEVESEERTKIINKVNYLMHKIIDYVDVDQAADKLGQKFIYDSMPPVLSKIEAKYTSKYDGDYMKDGKVLNRAEIGMDTEIRLVRYHSLRLVVENEAKLYYNTDNAKVYHGEEEQFLLIDESLIPCVKKLQNIYPEFIEVEKLPGDDNIAKAQLVSDLWERGLLVTNGSLPSFSEDDVFSDELSDTSL